MADQLYATPPDERERTSQELLKLVQMHAATLGKQFDSVQIFVTKSEKDQTLHAEWGVGNHMARLGQVYMWLIAENHTRLAEELRRLLPREET